MNGNETAATKFFRRYLAISHRPFDPSSSLEDPNVRQIFTSWHGADTEVLTQGHMVEVLKFTETELYDRTREIAETAARVQPIPEFVFNYLHINEHTAFARQISGKPVILFDADWKTFWFHMLANRIFSVYACESEAQRVALDKNALLAIAESNAKRALSDETRRELTPWYVSHAQHCAAALSLSYVMAYFVIAHEIGHIALDHLGAEDVHRTELEADAFAARTLVGLRERADLRWSNIPAGCLAAPLLLFHLVEIMDMATSITHGGAVDLMGYPTHRARRRALSPFFSHATAHDRGHYLDIARSFQLLGHQIQNGPRARRH